MPRNRRRRISKGESRPGGRGNDVHVLGPRFQPFRLDSQRLLSYLTSMRVLTLAVTPANSTTFWNTIYFYTASAAAGNLSYDCARGRHCTVSAAASRRHVDASLDLFTRKSPRIWRDLSEKRALSARRLILWMVGV